jgi:trigger factor
MMTVAYNTDLHPRQRKRITTLKVTTQELDNCEVLMTVEIDDRQKERLLEKAARRISRQVRIPGFRPGKAPYRIVVSKFGIEAIQDEAMSDLTQEVFQQALSEVDITPYAQASLDDVAWEPLTMKVKIPVNPVVELGDYRDIRVEFEEPEVTEEEVEEELQRLHDQQATYSPVDRAAQLGDRVSVTVSEKDLNTGEMLAEESDFALMLHESEEDDELIDFSSHLVGLAAGEQTIWTHTYPADYNLEKLAGKEVEIFTRVNEVKEKEGIELNDDFASLIGDYDTLDELKAGIKEDLIKRKQYEFDRELMPEVLDQVLETIETVKWPLALEEQELDHVIQQRERELAQQGLDLQTYLGMQQKTLEEYREELRESVQQNIKTSLVLGKIIELEKLEVDREELTQQAELMVMLSRGTREAQEAFRSPAGLQALANNLLYDKARERLLAIAKGEVEVEEIEGKAADAETETETSVQVTAEVETTDEVVAEANVIEGTAEEVSEETAELTGTDENEVLANDSFEDEPTAS